MPGFYRMPRSGVGAQDAYLVVFGRLGRGRMLDHFMKRTVKIVDHAVPGDLSVGDAVELLFDVGREVVVHDRLELRFEVVIDHHADIGRLESVFLLAVGFGKPFFGDLAAGQRKLHVAAFLALLVLFDHVPAVDDRRDGRRVGRRTSDAELFEPFYERSLVVAGRRCGEAFRGCNLRGIDALALGHFGEDARSLFARLLVRGFRVEFQESVETDHFARGDELGIRTGDIDDDRGAVELRRNPSARRRSVSRSGRTTSFRRECLRSSAARYTTGGSLRGPPVRLWFWSCNYVPTSISHRKV